MINDFSLARGGATTLALELANRVLEAGRAVTFFAGDDGRNPALAEAGADIVAIGGSRLLDSPVASTFTGLYNARAKNALSAWIRRHDNPSVVYHVNSWSQILSPSIFAALRPVAERSIVTAHDFFLACPNGNYTNYPKAKPCALTPMTRACILSQCDKRSYAHKIWRVLRQHSLRAAADFRASPFTVLAIQRDMIALLERGGIARARIALMRNPADRLRGRRIEAEKNREIFFLGRLQPEKGADLLAAAARLAGVPVRIIGEGPGEEAVRRANPDAVFEGWRSREDVAALFETARLLAMPSRCTEPFGLSAAEALRIGVPVVASRSSLIVGDLERLGMGVGVDVTNIEAFAETLRGLARDDARVHAMSASAFENAGEIAHSFEDWIGAHLDLYDRLTNLARMRDRREPRARSSKYKSANVL